jgi:hypothetical protein
MPDVISQGYTAVLYTLFMKAPFYLKMIGWEIAASLAFILVVVAVVQWKLGSSSGRMPFSMDLATGLRE